MRVFTCDDHAGLYPVGTASVVVATDEGEAHALLRQALIERGLGGEPFTLSELDTSQPQALVLRDGDY